MPQFVAESTMLSLTQRALWDRSSQTFNVCIIYMKRMRHVKTEKPITRAFVSKDIKLNAYKVK